MNQCNDDNDDFIIGFRPSAYYNTNNLIKRIINQGSKLSADQIMAVLNDLKSTVKSILIEGGIVCIDDLITFSPSLSLLPNNKNEKIGLKIKATIPFSLTEAVAMEFKPKESKNESSTN
jgi:nucleoid DNA-binding protein